jgi:hypothetical protein
MMATYQSNGFIGKEITTWIDSKRRVHNELFEESEKLNADCYQILSSVKINKDDLRQTLVACLFPRCMELFQATYILVERGMSPSANIMLRCLMETMFVLCAIAKNDDALNAYIYDNEELERLKNANKMLSHKSTTFSEIQLADIEKIKSEVEQKKNDQKIKKFSTEEFAKKADLHDWYLTAYNVTSRPVHATAKDMEQYLVIDEKENIKSIRFAPTDRETSTVLSDACESLITSLEQFLLVFGKDTTVCGEHWEKVKPLMQPV